MERFHSRGQELCKFIGKQERFYIGKDSNCHRTWFGTPTWPPLNCFGADIVVTLIKRKIEYTMEF